MTKQDNVRTIFLAIVCAIALALGIPTGSYLITAMYIATVLVAAFITREKDVYNLLYSVLLVSVFFDYVLYVPGIQSIYMFHIILGAFTLLSLYRAFKDRDVLKNIDKKIIVLYVIWFIYMCVSMTWALNKSLSVKYIAIYIMMFAFIVDMMIYNINKERLQKTFNLLLLLVSLIVVVGFTEVLLGKQLPVRHYIDGFTNLSQWHINVIKARPIAFSFNPNNLSATLAILSPLLYFAIYKFENIALKIWFVIASCMSFSLVVITTSRTGWVALIFGFAVFIIYSIFNIRNLGLKQMIFPIVLIAGLVVSYNYSLNLMRIAPVEDNNQGKITDMSLSNKFSSLKSFEEGNFEEGGEGSENVRGTIIQDVLVHGLIENKNILGYGVGNVEQYIKDQGHTGHIYSPHCYAIEILGDFGVPGVILYGIYYLYLLLSNIYIGFKNKSVMCFAAVAGLIAFAPASFGPSSITYVFSYWILIGISIALIQVEKQKDRSCVFTSKSKEFKMI